MMHCRKDVLSSNSSTVDNEKSVQVSAHCFKAHEEQLFIQVYTGPI